MTNHIQVKPELPTKRIAGYKAMAKVILSMWEVPEYYDPAGVSDFRETVNRLVPTKPGFLQLAAWFLAKHGPIDVDRSRKTGEIIMSNEEQKMEWRRFVLDNAEKRLRVHSQESFFFDEDQSQARAEHLDELVTGEQYLFKYRAEDVEVGVAFSAKASGFRREFDSNGDEIPGSRRAWS